MTQKEKLIKARAGLVLDQPFFGSLALRLKITTDPSCKTIWVDGETLGYNPGFVETLSMDELKGVLAHEVMHLCCAHQARRGERDPRKWNMAGDLAINPILKESGFRLPSGRLMDPAFKGLSAEEIYSRLPESPRGGGDGANGADGSNGDNNPDPGQTGEVRDTPGKDGQAASSGDLTESEQLWRVALAQAMTQAKAMGDLPAGLARMVQEILEPKVDWRAVLRRFVSQCARNDYQWFPPNRRFVHLGLYCPSIRSDDLPGLVIAVDTSASIDVSDLDQFCGEVNAILEEYDTKATVLYCDTSVAAVEVFVRDNLPLRLNAMGGGGTDFRPPFDWVAENGIRPAAFIYLTDLECRRFPEEEPPYPVLWARIGTWGKAPPFGEILEVV